MTLDLRDQARRLDSPPLQGRGRGWGLSANVLAELQNRARTMRSNPTEPEKRLWRHLSGGQLSGWKFRRQQVIGHFIADFACPSARIIVEVDGDTHDEARDLTRDEALAALGYRVVHFSNHDVMTNIEGVLHRLAAIVCRAEGPHPNPSPAVEGPEG